MLIRPFQRTIVDVIPHDRGANIGAGQNDASKMAELRSPVVPQLYIISVGIENNAFAVLHFFLILGGVKKQLSINMP